MRSSWKPFALLLVAGPLLACATGGPPPAAATGRDPEVITLEEIEATEAGTALQLVQQLRPRWMMRNRGDRTVTLNEADNTKVSVDGMAPREFAYLEEIPRAAVLEIRRLSPREATMLYGTGFNAGLIKVTTKR